MGAQTGVGRAAVRVCFVRRCETEADRAKEAAQISKACAGEGGRERCIWAQSEGKRERGREGERERGREGER